MSGPAPIAQRLRVIRIEGAPVVAVRVVLLGGARSEEIPGQALVTGRMLVEGTTRRDWHALAELGERRGMAVSGFGGFESHGVTLDALADDWEMALELAAETLFESTFPEERCTWIVRHAAAELEAQDDQAAVVTGRAFARLLYESHPKGRPLQGDRASLERLRGETCRAWHRSALRHPAAIVVAGKIDPERVARFVADRFAGVGASTATPPAEPAPPPPPAARRREVATPARDQAHLFVGQLSVNRADADYEALEIAGVVLGSGTGLAGRLPLRIRDVEGLAYEASADTVAGAGRDAGRLGAYLGTAPENLERAEMVIRDELVRLRDGGLSDDEIAEARSYLIGREPFRRESARQCADLAAVAAVAGLPLDDPDWRIARLEAVDREAIRRALARCLDPERLSVAVGLPGGQSGSEARG